MEGRETTSFYHRNFPPPTNNNNHLNPAANVVYTAGCLKPMVSPEQSISISNNNNNLNSNSNSNTDINNNASPPSHPFSEYKNPNAIFAHPVRERAVITIGVAGTDTFKRKRGRPRKYGTDAEGFATMGIGLSPFSPDKRGFGSRKKAQMVALGCAGQGFTAHVITIAAGEDVCKKIMAFMQHGPWAVCVLSANGAISNATLRQPAMSGGIVTYEGRFEILSLSGSFLLTEVGGTHTRTGGLSVSLAGSDGRVVGGGVGGLLTAATPVQVVVGTFLVDSKKDLVCIGNGEPLMGTLSACMSGGCSPPFPVVMQSTIEASSGGSNLGKGCHGEQNSGSNCYNMQSQVLNMTSLQSMDWASPHFKAEIKSDRDVVLTGRAKSMDQADGSQSIERDEEEEHKDCNVTFEN